MTSGYLTAAIEIGENLVADATPSSVGVTWAGDDLIGSDEYNSTVIHKLVGADFYGGASGIAWFLGHLAKATTSRQFAKSARGGLGFSLNAVADDLGPENLSLYSGATGVALAAAEVAHLLNDSVLGDQALALAHEVAEIIIADALVEANDLLNGLAGLSVGLLTFYRMTGESLFLDAASAACRQLVARRSDFWWGSSWPDAKGQSALCGLAHGVSGIGLALAETAWVTEDTSMLEIAHAAFRYERSHFSRERCAWPDLREPEMPGWTTAWCHGALGIGAARLRYYEITGADWALAEASAALQAARALAVQAGRDATVGIAHDVTLCHGLGGATELILLAAEILKAPEHGLAARRIADLCFKIRLLNGGRWTNGLRGCENVPGLLTGLAGIGVSMLRVHTTSSIGSPMLFGRRPEMTD